MYTVDWKKTQSASVDMVIARCTYRNINKYICIALLISSGSTITRSPNFSINISMCHMACVRLPTVLLDVVAYHLSVFNSS